MYMCFPCYREFNTLEEVLQHQLTCTAEDEQPDTSGTAPIAVPVLQTRVIPEQVRFCHVLTWVGLKIKPDITVDQIKTEPLNQILKM